jgi:hypothetical protein
MTNESFFIFFSIFHICKSSWGAAQTPTFIIVAKKS